MAGLPDVPSMIGRQGSDAPQAMSPRTCGWGSYHGYVKGMALWTRCYWRSVSWRWGFSCWRGQCSRTRRPRPSSRGVSPPASRVRSRSRQPEAQGHAPRVLASSGSADTRAFHDDIPGSLGLAASAARPSSLQHQGQGGTSMPARLRSLTVPHQQPDDTQPAFAPRRLPTCIRPPGGSHARASHRRFEGR